MNGRRKNKPTFFNFFTRTSNLQPDHYQTIRTMLAHRGLIPGARLFTIVIELAQLTIIYSCSVNDSFKVQKDDVSCICVFSGL
jgi:hypothetical protein